ncbi:MAG TPA: hypothetical protein P5262_01055 [Candidatus Moranbacteria bacterium]|nr:hypothetical protein [Candidatus Moranbacteria bacterium]
MRFLAITAFLVFLLLAIASLSASECMAAGRLNFVMRQPPPKQTIIYPVFWMVPEEPSRKPITI